MREVEPWRLVVGEFVAEFVRELNPTYLAVSPQAKTRLCHHVNRQAGGTWHRLGIRLIVSRHYSNE
jgi:hypothetical protein